MSAAVASDAAEAAVLPAVAGDVAPAAAAAAGAAAPAAAAKPKRPRDDRPAPVILAEHLAKEPKIATSDEIQGQIAKKQQQIKELQATVDTLTGQIDTEVSIRNEARKASQLSFEKVQEAKKITSSVKKEFTAMNSVLKADRDARTQQNAAVRAAEGRLGKIRSIDDINQRIAQIEARIQTESVPIQEEKALVKEIKALNAARPEVQVIHGMRDAIEFSDNKEKLDEVRASSKVKKGELDAAFTSQKELYAAASVKREIADKSNEKVEAMLKQRKETRASLRAAMDDERKLARQQSKGNYVHERWTKRKLALEERVTQYNEYLEREKKRDEKKAAAAKRAEERKAQQEEWEKRQAARKERDAQRKKEQDEAFAEYQVDLKAWEAERATADPWEGHKAAAQHLLHYLRPFAPDDYVEPVEQDEEQTRRRPVIERDDTHLPEGVPLERPSAMAELLADGGIDYLEGAKGKGKGSKRRKKNRRRNQRQAVSVLHHSPDIFSQFEFLELRASVPLERTSVPAALDALKAKLKWMDEQKEGPKKPLKQVVNVEVPKPKRKAKAQPLGKRKRSEFPSLATATGDADADEESEEDLYEDQESEDDDDEEPEMSLAARMSSPAQQQKKQAATAAAASPVAPASAAAAEPAAAAASQADKKKKKNKKKGKKSPPKSPEPPRKVEKFEVTSPADVAAAVAPAGEAVNPEFTSQSYWKSPVADVDDLSDFSD